MNRQGQFNVPHGRYANPRIPHADGLRAASRSLQRAELTAVDFEEACEQAAPGDFVYLDPPYQPLSATSNFTSYTSQEFSDREQRRLSEAFDGLTQRGVAAMLSNSSHTFIRELYEGKGYSIETVLMARAINAKGDGRAPVDELLISNLESGSTLLGHRAAPSHTRQVLHSRSSGWNATELRCSGKAHWQCLSFQEEKQLCGIPQKGSGASG